MYISLSNNKIKTKILLYKYLVHNFKFKYKIYKYNTYLNLWIFDVTPESLYIPSTIPNFSINSAQLVNTSGTKIKI